MLIMAENTGEQIGVLLASQGKTPYWLAKQTGLSTTYIEKLRDGKVQNPSWNNLLLISRALGFDTVEAMTAAASAVSDFDSPPVTYLRAVKWPEHEIADMETDWPGYSVKRRIELVQMARQILEDEEEMQRRTEEQKQRIRALLQRSKPATEPAT